MFLFRNLFLLMPDIAERYNTQISPDIQTTDIQQRRASANHCDRPVRSLKPAAAYQSAWQFMVIWCMSQASQSYMVCLW